MSVLIRKKNIFIYKGFSNSSVIFSVYLYMDIFFGVTKAVYRNTWATFCLRSLLHFLNALLSKHLELLRYQLKDWTGNTSANSWTERR